MDQEGLIPQPPPALAQPALWVFYDGGCPVCRAEIGHYQRLTPLVPVCFVDAAGHALPASGPDRAALLARLHVRQANGQWRSGAAAFAALWRCYPRWRWLGRLLGLAWINLVAEGIYRLFLKVRPLWRTPTTCTTDSCPRS